MPQMHYICKSMNRYTLGFSSCPNDTFIFDGVVNKRFSFSFSTLPLIEDVESLNKKSEQALLDITKLSFAAYPFVADSYQILSAGSALGTGCGPLLISKEKIDLSLLNSYRVAIPGRRTTANMLLGLFYPEISEKSEVLFSEIENELIKGTFPLGLIIHENRFTYEKKGLLKVADLGELWESRFSLPIPLGCIAVRRSLPEREKFEIQSVIRQSVIWAFDHPEDSHAFVQQHAAEMSEEVQKMHIGLYVNQFSIDLGEEGKAAVRMMFKQGHDAGVFPKCTDSIFVNDL